MNPAFEWLFNTAAVRKADEALALESPLRRARRERSRALHDSAVALGRSNARNGGWSEGTALLNREGLNLALAALTEASEHAGTGAVWLAVTDDLLVQHVGIPDIPRLRQAAAAASPNDAELLATAHDRALAALEQPLTTRRDALINRYTRLTLLVLLVGSVVLASLMLAHSLFAPINLAKDKPWRTSSTGLVCHPETHNCGGTTTDIFFHTLFEENPWLEIDLGQVTTFSGLTVRNRQDMGVDRAVPMVVEVSDDRKTWREVVRQSDVFATWKPSFPTVSGRYVRLKVLKKTWFHLDGVEVHP